MKKYNKKGMSLGEGFPAVLSLVLIALIVIIAVFIFITLTSNLPGTITSTINESGWINSTGYNLINISSCNAKNPLVVYVYNGTGDEIINAANYTLTTSSSAWTIKNTTSWRSNSVKIVYSYTWGDQACVASSASAVQFGTYPALIGLIGTIIFLAILIGVLIGAFVGRVKGA
jgi:hypothetical protein